MSLTHVMGLHAKAGPQAVVLVPGGPHEFVSVWHASVLLVLPKISPYLYVAQVQRMLQFSELRVVCHRSQELVVHAACGFSPDVEEVKGTGVRNLRTRQPLSSSPNPLSNRLRFPDTTHRSQRNSWDS